VLAQLSGQVGLADAFVLGGGDQVEGLAQQRLVEVIVFVVDEV
jgi:hypothetical protein